MYTRRKFSREFKLEAVKMVKDRGVALKQVARDLDLNENMLRRWIRESSEDPQDAFPGLGNMKPEQAEIARLQREVAKLKMERDILKKAAAYIAKESMRNSNSLRNTEARGLLKLCASRSVYLEVASMRG